MKAVIALVLAALVATAFADRLAISRNGDIIPNNYNLLFRKDVTAERAKAFAESIGARRFASFRDFKFASIVAKENVIQRLAERTDLFEAIEQDQVVSISYKNDSGVFGRQTGATWGLDRIDQKNLPLDTIYNYKDSAGSGAYVYVIDTGVLATHNEFGGRATLGPNFHDSGADSTDDNGHGTHCSGTIAGTTYGVAKRATIVGIKVLGRLGSGSLSNVANGVAWAAEDSQGRRAVASMSLGGSVSTILDRAVEEAIASGLAVIAASGNSNADACSFSPAHVASLSVNAIDDTDTRASFSNYGTCTDLFAPGVDITSAWIGSNSATSTISGTSMACPHVAGAAAVLLGEGSYSPAALSAAIISQSTTGIVRNPGTGSPNVMLYSPY
jgi:serine protease